MTKPVIAVDIDDVLAAQAAAIVAYSNREYGSDLTINDYDEYWAKMWKVDDIEAERRAVEYHESGDHGTYRPHPNALPVLRKLRQSYSLVIITSRRTAVSKITDSWIAQHYEGIFDQIHLAGIWDAGVNQVAAARTKSDIATELGASYLIDDQLKHCLSAAEAGVEAILFGDYNWNQTTSLPEHVTRCKDWAAVLEYFDARG